MAWTVEKGTEDIVMNGWEKGIAPSPHEGVANMQCVNISTEMGEAMCNYARTMESTGLSTNRNLSATNTSSLFIMGSGSSDVLVGGWIHITNSGGGAISTGYYYVLSSSSGTLTLSSTYKGSAVVAGATGTAVFSTVPMRLPTASAVEDLGGGDYNYYILDKGDATTGLQVWLRPANDAHWYGLIAPTTNIFSNATGLAFFPGVSQNYYSAGTQTSAKSNSFLVVLADDGVSIKNCLVANTLNVRFSTFAGFAAFTAFAPTTINIHSEIYGHDNVIYGLDGQNIMSLQPKFPNTVGTFTAPSGSSSTQTVASFTAGIGLQLGMAVVLTTSNTLPTGLSPGTTYYVVAVSGLTFSLATSVGGSPITTSSAGTGTHGFTSVYFQPIAGTLAGSSIAAEPQSYTANQQALTLPSYETAQCIAELGVNLMIGGKTNNLYPWDRTPIVSGQGIVSNSYNYPVLLPEANIVQLLTVNNLLYCFVGSKGNIYITNGQTATGALSVPDYVTGQIEPYFIWGGVMYGRGRIWFSIQQGSGTPNVGGVWSFVPTTNFFVGQDVGASLRLEHQNSYNTYAGYASVLLLNSNQAARGIQYFAGWTDGVSTFGIDNSATTPYTNGQTIIETDIIETGTFLAKRTFTQVELKLAAPLVAGESVAVNYRTDITASWLSMPVQNAETGTVSVYYTVPFEKTQWVQFQPILTSTASNPSFVRLREVRLR